MKDKVIIQQMIDNLIKAGHIIVSRSGNSTIYEWNETANKELQKIFG